MTSFALLTYLRHFSSGNTPLYRFLQPLHLPSMKAQNHVFFPHRTPGSPITEVNLDATEAAHIARTLAHYPQQPRPQLAVDCRHLRCLHTLGVSHVVSELLVLRQAGADIWLHNLTPTLAHCLALLKLTGVFRTAPTPA